MDLFLAWVEPSRTSLESAAFLVIASKLLSVSSRELRIYESILKLLAQFPFDCAFSVLGVALASVSTSACLQFVVVDVT